MPRNREWIRRHKNIFLFSLLVGLSFPIQSSNARAAVLNQTLSVTEGSASILDARLEESASFRLSFVKTSGPDSVTVMSFFKSMPSFEIIPTANLVYVDSSNSAIAASVKVVGNGGALAEINGGEAVSSDSTVVVSSASEAIGLIAVEFRLVITERHPNLFPGNYVRTFIATPYPDGVQGTPSTYDVNTRVTGKTVTTLSLSSGSSGHNRGTVVSLVATSTELPGKYTFMLNGRRVVGCRNVVAIQGTGSCQVRLSRHGVSEYAAVFVPTDNRYLTSRGRSQIYVVRR